VLIPVT